MYVICRAATQFDSVINTGQAMGPGEYFATEANISLGYCKGGHQMIVFAIIMDKSGLTADANNVIVVNKMEHQLPLFVVSF